MPELPEVETVRRDLEENIVGKKIIDVEVKYTKTLHNDEIFFVDMLKGNSVVCCERIGKLLFFKLQKGDQYLLVHLKMTGKLLYIEKGSVVGGGHSLSKPLQTLDDKHTRVIINFSNGSKLFFHDLRKFGYMKLASLEEVEKIKSTFGIEPLTPRFTWENFEKALQGRKTALKAVLLNQNCIAGIGNIYADEICFATGILPSRSVEQLSVPEKKALFEACNEVIQKAIIHRGTSFNSYVDGQGKKGKFEHLLQVYRRQGKPCFVCGAILQKTRVAGRGTHFCSQCQK